MATPSWRLISLRWVLLLVELLAQAHFVQTVEKLEPSLDWLHHDLFMLLSNVGACSMPPRRINNLSICCIRGLWHWAFNLLRRDELQLNVIAASRPLLGLIILRSHRRYTLTFGYWALAVGRCRHYLNSVAGWLKCNACEGEILQWALQLDRGVLQSVVIDEVSFIEVSVPTDLLAVILINHADVLREIGLVVETVQALAWSQFAETIDLFRLLVKNTVIRDKRVSGLFKYTINFN